MWGRGDRLQLWVICGRTRIHGGKQQGNTFQVSRRHAFITIRAALRGNQLHWEVVSSSPLEGFKQRPDGPSVSVQGWVGGGDRVRGWLDYTFKIFAPNLGFYDSLFRNKHNPFQPQRFRGFRSKRTGWSYRDPGRKGPRLKIRMREQKGKRFSKVQQAGTA